MRNFILSVSATDIRFGVRNIYFPLLIVDNLFCFCSFFVANLSVRGEGRTLLGKVQFDDIDSAIAMKDELHGLV
jgi:predicted nucleic acid-binding Zn finger protein